MPTRDFLLPDLGEGLEDAEVLAWRVAEGDHVELNQTLVEVNTAKAVVEIPAPWDGVVEKLHAAEGDIVKVGRPLVSIRVADEEPGSDGDPAGDAPLSKRQAVLVGYGVDDDATTRRPKRSQRDQPRAGRDGRKPVRATPPVRKLAKDLGVDLSAVRGTGVDGRITREDVLNAGPVGGEGDGSTRWTEADADAGEEIIPVRGNRRIIARVLTDTVREVPHVTTFLTVDATWLMALRDELSVQSGQRLSPLPVVVRALASICHDHPKLNASFSSAQQQIALYREVHVGIATDTTEGLLVPVVRSVNRRGILDIAGDIERLSEAARAHKLTVDDMAGGTITVTNVGSFGAEAGTPIINGHQSTILALGVIESRALVVEGQVEARLACTLSLSFDHRVLDGAEAGRALRAVKDLLESPFRLGGLPR